MSAIPKTETQPEASPAPQKVRGARILCEALLREGVDTIFGYPGGAVLHIYDELYNMRDRLHHVLVRHEQGAVHMAEGYAKSTGRVGVVLVTSGPGATNAVTGIADAFLDSIPLVIITGQVPRKMIGSDAFQEVDTVGITRPCTKYNYLVRDASELASVVHEAFHIASTGRPGPVLIDIPKDVTAELADFEFCDSVQLRSYSPESLGDPDEVRRAVELMRQSERPILYVGGGIVHSGATDELVALADRLGFPVSPTLMGLGGFPSGHPHCLGMLGMHGTYASNMAISDSDLIIALGVRFDDRVTGALDKFAPHAEVIHVDIDPSSIHKNRRANVPIVGDAKSVIRQMLSELDAQGDPERSRTAAWWERIAAWQAHAPLSYEPSADAIKPQQLVQKVYELTRGEAIVSTDVGQHQMWFAQFHPFKEGRQWLTSGGLGTMGYGFPAALGAKVANRDRQVVAFVGDGGFQMTAQELATAVQYGLDVKVVIMNNGYLGMVRQWQELFYDRAYSHVDMHSGPDFVKLAEAYGASGFRADAAGGAAFGSRDRVRYAGPRRGRRRGDRGRERLPDDSSGCGIEGDSARMMTHTLSILVENHYGELARVVGVFGARGMNIESLCVAETLDPTLSRVTLVTNGDDRAVAAIVRQLEKQVRVLHVTDMAELRHVERELVLVGVRAEAGTKRQEVLSLSDVFRARVVDMNEEGVVIEATGNRSKVSALLDLLKPFGIVDVVRTGPVALARLSETSALRAPATDGELVAD